MDQTDCEKALRRILEEWNKDTPVNEFCDWLFGYVGGHPVDIDAWIGKKEDS